MRVSDIWSDLIELTGVSDTSTNYRALSLGLDWLANEHLFDPLIGYVDFTVDEGYLIALPREVKTPLRLNINNNPAFHRSRLWEFTANTDGSVDGEEVGWVWDNRGYAKVQDERPLPTHLRYVVDDPLDVGKTLIVRFYDEDGRVHHETLTAADEFSEASESIAMIHAIESIVRQATEGDGYLVATDGRTVARYYNDEEQPEYRVIKLSKTGVAIRMMFRRHAPQVFSTQGDVIPFHSRLAIIWAAKTVRLLQDERYDAAAAAAQLAKDFASKEQKARDEGEELSAATEVCGARNQNISNLDSLIVADVYDEASEIFGPIGREKLFDRIGQARDLLANKGLWDATIGNVDVWKPDNSETVTPLGQGHGIFTLPRWVGSVAAVRPQSVRSYPRNGWFEFHLNGTGEQYRSDVGTWDMLGTTCIYQDLLLDPDTKKVIPVQLAAICENALDEDKVVRVYGLERLEDDREVEVWRDGVQGYELTMATSAPAPEEDAPNWVRIDRVKKDATTGFVRLAAVTAVDTPVTEPAPVEVILGPCIGQELATTFYYNGQATGNVPTSGDIAIDPDDHEAEIETESDVASGLDLTNIGFTVEADTEFDPAIGQTIRARLNFQFTAIGTVVAENVNGVPQRFELSQDPPAGLAVGDVLRFRNDGVIFASPYTVEITSINGRVITMGGGALPGSLVGTEVQLKELRTTTVSEQTVTVERVLGYYYPDELEPTYRKIKVHSCKEIRVSIRYKMRLGRLASLYQPLHLKSSLALVEAMRSIEKRKAGDYQGAASCEADALRFLREKEESDHPTDVVRMQFDSGMTQGGFGNIA